MRRSAARIGLLLCAAATAWAAAPKDSGTLIDLWPEGVPGQRPNDPPDDIRPDGHIYHVHRPTLQAFPLPAGTGDGTAVIICPGGGYVRLPAPGGNGGAEVRWLHHLGIAAFVLTYRLGDAGVPAPLQDAARAIRIVRSRAAEFGIRPDRVGVFGGSAGGHVAAWLSTGYASAAANTGAALDAVNARPDFAILLYPVITMLPPYAHAGSVRALLGTRPTEAAEAALSMDRRVSAATPPTFLVSTEQDRSVPEENAMLYYEALWRAHVPAELHLYQLGPHGFGFRQGLGDTSLWPERCAEWLRSQGW